MTTPPRQLTPSMMPKTRASIVSTGAVLSQDIYRAPSPSECMIECGDREIRELLLRELHTYGLRTVTEWNVGACRIDVAAIAHRLHGYEIKSPRDSLARLDRQARNYGRVFDTLTLVADVAHLDAAEPMLPEWWGLTAVIPSLQTTGTWQLTLAPVRKAQQNPEISSTSMLMQLWCRELRAMISRYGAATRALRSSKYYVGKNQMVAALAANVPRGRLLADAVGLLTQRTEWRLSE